MKTWELLGLKNQYEFLNHRFSVLLQENSNLKTESQQFKSLYNESEMATKVYKEKAFKAVDEIYHLKNQLNLVIWSLKLANVDSQEYEYEPRRIQNFNELIHDEKKELLDKMHQMSSKFLSEANASASQAT